MEESERGGQWVRGVHSRVGEAAEAGGGVACGQRAASTRPASDWREVEDASAPGGLGYLTGLPAGQVSGLTGKLCSVLVPFCFLLFNPLPLF